MSERIVFSGSEREFTCPELPRGAVRAAFAGGRHLLEITVYATVDEIKAAFTDGVTYAREWDSQDGDNTLTMTDDLSAYSIAGDIVDHRDGTVTVFMGKPTELELTNAELDEAEAAMREGVNSLE